MFKYIKIVDDLSDITSSSAFASECLTERSNIGKEVWIKYYRNENEGASHFTVSDEDTPLGGVHTIMLYVKNEDGTYNVYGYAGKLEIDRRKVQTLSHDILLNVDGIIAELELFLDNLNNNNKCSHN